MTDFETPNIDFSNRDAALQQIWSFVLSFQEQVSYWLRNLDKDSFNEQGLKEITEPITAQPSATINLAWVVVFSGSSKTATPASARNFLAGALTLFSSAL